MILNNISHLNVENKEMVKTVKTKTTTVILYIVD